MNAILVPLNAKSVSDQFVDRFEKLILGGALGPGEKLPSERDLAMSLGVSRPVVHQGLLELAHRGLVTLKPRVGAVVNDVGSQGSLATLVSLFNAGHGRPDPALVRSILEVRHVIECETARLAALRATPSNLEDLRVILGQEQAEADLAPHLAAARDFSFHHAIARASGNGVYPLLLNSFKEFYLAMAGLFYQGPVRPQVYRHHEALLASIAQGRAEDARDRMDALLTHGAHILLTLVDQGKD